MLNFHVSLFFRSNVMLIHAAPNEESGEKDIDLTYETEILEAIDPTHSAFTTDDCTYYSEEIGAQICWSALFPNSSDSSPLFPLSGSSHLRILVKKTDPMLRNFLIRYSLQRQSVSCFHFMV